MTPKDIMLANGNALTSKVLKKGSKKEKGVEFLGGNIEAERIF